MSTGPWGNPQAGRASWPYGDLALEGRSLSVLLEGRASTPCWCVAYSEDPALLRVCVLLFTGLLTVVPCPSSGRSGLRGECPAGQDRGEEEHVHRHPILDGP